MKDAIKIFKALSDETRLRLYKVLQVKDGLCVCQIMQALDMSQTRVSRNLGMLKQAGLVTDERHGKWVHYWLAKDGKQVQELISKIVIDDEVIKSDRDKIKSVKHVH